MSPPLLIANVARPFYFTNCHRYKTSCPIHVHAHQIQVLSHIPPRLDPLGSAVSPSLTMTLRLTSQQELVSCLATLETFGPRHLHHGIDNYRMLIACKEHRTLEFWEVLLCAPGAIGLWDVLLCIPGATAPGQVNTGGLCRSATKPSL